MHDFEVHHLIPAVVVFAASFDALPELITGRSAYRILIAAGSSYPGPPWSANWPPMGSPNSSGSISTWGRVVNASLGAAMIAS